MDWVIIITALQIIAVATSSIEKAPCNRALKSNLTINQTRSTNHSSVGNNEEYSNVHDDNCTNKIANQTPEDQKQEHTEEYTKNIPDTINNDDELAEYDGNYNYGANNTKITHKYDTKATKREKAVKVDKAFSQRSVIKESNAGNESGYISTDDIRNAMRRSNSKRSKNHSKTDNSKIYVFKDNLHPVYQIKKVDRNDLRSIKLNKTPKITILRRNTNNKQVSNKINEEMSLQNKINVNKNVTDVRENLLDHLLKYFMRIMQEDKNKGMNNGGEKNKVETQLGDHYDSRIWDEADDPSLNSNHASDESLHSDSSTDELINNATNTIIYKVDENLEENNEEDRHQDEHQNDQNDDIQNVYEETVITDLSINNNDSMTESYTYILGISNTDAEIVNVTDTSQIPTSFDNLSVADDMISNETNNEVLNNTKSTNEIDIDSNIKKHINILLENVDYKNGTTIDIDIPLNRTEDPIIINTHNEKNLSELSDLTETKTTFTSDDFADIDDEVYNAEVKRTDVEHEDNFIPMVTNAQFKSASNDDEDHIQEQTRRILLGILDKNKKGPITSDGNEIEDTGNCQKRLKVHIDINVF